MPHSLKQICTAAAVAVATAVPLVVATAAAAPPAGALPAQISVIGHGYGHGRGMGQFGADGYAQDGWTYQQILSHYYGGTTPEQTTVSSVDVDLDEIPTVTSLSVSAPSGQTVLVNGTNTAKATVTLAEGQTASTSGGGDVTVNGAYWYDENSREYAGKIELTSSGAVVNIVPLQSYVEGVVPREMYASWPEAALEAQAVAVRTYVLAYLADNPVTAICDNSGCQNYGGDPAQYSGGDASASNAAVTATGNEVLACSATGPCGQAGQLAYAEYSASTGGYTAGGDFPAVVDAGDAATNNPANPYHTWSATVASSTIASEWGLGTLESIKVTSRNGDGDWGGRVEEMTLTGSAKTVQVTGAEFADYLGLDSDWFTLSSQTPPAGSDTGYWVVGSDGSVFNFGAAGSYGSEAGHSIPSPITAMAPTADGGGYWLVASNGGIYALGDAANHGSATSLPLTAAVDGIAGTTDGGGYWLISANGGVFTYGDAGFYGSASPYHPKTPIIAIARTPDGKGYWLVSSAGGVFTFGDAGFHGSAATMGLRVPVVAFLPTPDGKGYWLITSNGGVLTYGDAGFYGSAGGTGQTGFVGGMATPDGGGYLLVTGTGSVETYGDATWLGDPSSSDPAWTGRSVALAAS